MRSGSVSRCQPSRHCSARSDWARFAHGGQTSSSYLLRRKTVPWAEVQDVIVVSGSSLRTTYSPGIKTGSGEVRLNGVIGSQSYVENIVAEIRQARPATPTAPNPEHAETSPRTVGPDSAA